MNFTIGNSSYVLKQAEMDDLNKVLGLLTNAAVWLKTKGTTQWDYYVSDLEGNIPEVQDSIETGATYILEQGERIVASVTLENTPNDWDRDIWGEDANGENVMYLHRLVVHREFAGQGIGGNLLKWAENHAKSLGKSIIRFDCITSNVGLNKYYQKRYELKEIANIYGQHCKYEIIVV